MTLKNKDALEKKVRSFLKTHREAEPTGYVMGTKVSLVCDDKGRAEIAAVAEAMDNGDCIITLGDYYDRVGTALFYGTDDEKDAVGNHLKDRKMISIEL